MSIQNGDIVFTFSGGASNSNPDVSLGGVSSSTQITGTRLFSDLTTSQTQTGLIDYRCIYLHNENTINSLYNTKIFVSYTVPGDVSVLLGFDFANDQQSVNIINGLSAYGGSIQLIYTDISGYHTVTIGYATTVNGWIQNVQNALQTITNLENVYVTGSSTGTDVNLIVNFQGTAAYRFHDLLMPGSNTLQSAPYGYTQVVTSKIKNGGPINQLATQVFNSTTAPTNIVFAETFPTLTIQPLDSIPIWIQRITPAGAGAVLNDGFTLTIQANGLP